MVCVQPTIKSKKLFDITNHNRIYMLSYNFYLMFSTYCPCCELTISVSNAKASISLSMQKQNFFSIRKFATFMMQQTIRVFFQKKSFSKFMIGPSVHQKFSVRSSKIVRIALSVSNLRRFLVKQLGTIFKVHSFYHVFIFCYRYFDILF